MTDAAYYAQREREERTLAERAADPKVCDIHLDMAHMYAGLSRAKSPASRLASYKAEKAQLPLAE